MQNLFFGLLTGAVLAVATSGFAAPQIGPFMEPFSGGGDLPEGV